MDEQRMQVWPEDNIERWTAFFLDQGITVRLEIVPDGNGGEDRYLCWTPLERDAPVDAPQM